jgi:hypothetical protein
MTDQPGDALTEAVKLYTTLRRRLRGSGSERDDVWSQATREVDQGFATGAAECRYCPICRTIAAARTSGPDVLGHVVDAGQSLMAALQDTLAGYERSRPPRRPSEPRSPTGGDPMEAG